MIPWKSKFLKILGINPDMFYMSWSKQAHTATMFTLNKHLKTLNTSYTINDPYILFHADVEQSQTLRSHWAENLEAMEALYLEIVNDMKPYEALHIIMDLAQPLHTVEKVKGEYDQKTNLFNEGNFNDQNHALADMSVNDQVIPYAYTEIITPPLTVAPDDFHVELRLMWMDSQALASTMEMHNRAMTPEEALSRYKYGVALCKLYLTTKMKNNQTIQPDVIKQNKAINNLSADDDIEIYNTTDPNYTPIDSSINKDYLEINDTYTIQELEDRIESAQGTTGTIDQIYAPKYLTATCASEINRMVKGESLLRIGDIWIGKDKYSTVTGFSVYTNKEVRTVQPLRVDLALSMSTSMSPIDTIQIEIVCHVSQMKSIIQRLSIMTEITPSVPVMNPALAAILVPLIQNKKIYEAYGIDTNALSGPSPNKTDLLTAYASTPIQAHIDNINITYTGPRDIRLLLTISRVMSSNSYGDRIMYCQTMQDSFRQHVFMKEFKSGVKDTDQIKAYGTAFGVYNNNLNEMVEELTKIPRSKRDNYAPFEANIVSILDGDTVWIERLDMASGQNQVKVRLFGIDAPEGDSFTKNLYTVPNAHTDTTGNGFMIPIPVKIANQPFSNEAKYELTRLLESVRVKKTDPIKITVQPYGWDSTGERIMGELFITLPSGKILCVNSELVKQGLAYITTTDITMDDATARILVKYYDAQAYAKSRSLGVWSLPDEKRELPSVFRDRAKAALQTDTHIGRFQY